MGGSVAFVLAAVFFNPFRMAPRSPQSLFAALSSFLKVLRPFLNVRKETAVTDSSVGCEVSKRARSICNRSAFPWWNFFARSIRSPWVTSTVEAAAVLLEVVARSDDVLAVSSVLLFLDLDCPFFKLIGCVLSELVLVPSVALKNIALNSGVNNSRCTGSATAGCGG